MKKLKKVAKWLGLVMLVVALLGGGFYMIYLRPFIQKMKVVQTIQYDKDLTIVIGGGGNSGIITSDSLVIVVDTKMDEAAQELYNKVKAIAGNKAVLVVNTHFHPDHVGGNKLYSGATVLAGANYGKEGWIKEAGEQSLPNKWLSERLDIKMGDDTVSIINYGKNAHTESDVFVYSHKRKLLFGGDVILNKQCPIIMGKGRARGYLEAFNYLQTNFDIKHVVPGHGEFGGAEVIEDYYTYFKDMKLAAADASQKDALLNKYAGWNSIPFVMSPKATLKAFGKEGE
ncbi:MAG: MBL fold metallo-hydrolase [Bacteroidia bacterium]|nr:MBL fold metallo-hydrolase [Bacteroidia bacterium]